MSSDDIVNSISRLAKEFRQEINRFPSGSFLLRWGLENYWVRADDVVLDPVFETVVFVEGVLLPSPVHNDVPQEITVLIKVQSVFRELFESPEGIDLLFDLEAANDELTFTRDATADHEDVVTDMNGASDIRNASSQCRHVSEDRVIHDPAVTWIGTFVHCVDVSFHRLLPSQ
jgi:hypothetical protein